MIRKMAYDQQTIQLTTGYDYLRLYPSNQVVMPSMSSWGYQGYSETWLMGRNHWIYPALYDAVDTFEALLEEFAEPGDDVRAALDQYLRELLLAQSSDWPFILHQETVMKYASGRVMESLETMRRIDEQLRQNSVDSEWIRQLRHKNPLFPDLDLVRAYQESRQRVRG
jgi:1,4-alpha-glucan branching enzyme